MANVAPNPYYDPNLGTAFSNVASAIFGDPDRAAAYATNQAQEGLLAQKTADLAHSANARNRLQQVLLGFDPKNPENANVVRQIASEGVGANGDLSGLSDLGKVLLGLTANTGGTDAQDVSALVGAGQTLGKDDAVSLPGQEAIRTGNFAQDTAIKNSELANALLIGDRKNATDIAAEQLRQAGDNQRFHANIGAGETGVFAADNPAGVPTTVQGVPTEATAKGNIITQMTNGAPVSPLAQALMLAPHDTSAGGTSSFVPGDPRAPSGTVVGQPTTETAKGNLITEAANGGTLSPLAQALLLPPVNTPAGNVTSAVPGDPRMPSGSTTGLPTADTQKGEIIQNMNGAGEFTDPEQQLTPGSLSAVLMGMTGQPGSQHLVTNDKGDRVVDGPNVHVGLPGGKPNTPHNYKTPDNKIVMSTDGLTDNITHAPLPAGTVQVGSVPASLTEAQGKATGYALAMDGAMKDIQQLPAGFDPTGAVLHLTADANIPLTAVQISSKFNNPDQQRYIRAAAEIIAVILRGDSGAAITPAEFSQYAPIYLPQVGDEQPVMTDKWNALNVRRQSFIAQSGNGYGTAMQQLQGGNGLSGGFGGNVVDISKEADPDAAYAKMAPGTHYTGPDGVERVK